MPVTFNPALVLRLYDWSETSQIAVLLTRDFGLIRALAKGARRPVAKFSGGFELLTVGTAGLLIKPEADLATATEWDLTDPLWHLRRALPAFYQASLVAELLQRMIIDREPQPTIFAASVAFLHSLRQAPEQDGALLRLLWLMLEHLGYQPQVQASLSGEPLPDAGVLLFSPEHGGVVAQPSDSSAGAASPAIPGPLWPVHASTMHRLAALDAEPVGPLSALGGGDAEPEGPDTRRATRLLVGYCEYIISQPLSARRFCFPEWAAQPPPRDASAR